MISIVGGGKKKKLCHSPIKYLSLKYIPKACLKASSPIPEQRHGHLKIIRDRMSGAHLDRDSGGDNFH